MMKRIWIAALALLPLCGSAPAEKMVTGVACTKAVFKDPVPAGATTLLLASGGSIYICGYTVVIGTAASVITLEYGTQTSTPCDTGTTKITPAWSLGIGAIMIENSHQFRGLGVPAGNQLCVVQSGGIGPTQLELYYDQF